MRCSCHECGTYMNQSESMELGCVCPDCGYRCKACLGTNTVVSREDLKKLQYDRFFLQELFGDPVEPIPVRKGYDPKDEYLD